MCYAPGQSAANYLATVNQVFEENGWNWTYHAFREWEGWSVEHEGTSSKDIRRAPDNSRSRLMRSLFSRN